MRRIIFVIVLLIILTGCIKEDMVEKEETPSGIKPGLETGLPEPLGPSGSTEVVKEERLEEEAEIPEEPKAEEHKKVVYIEIRKYEFVPSKLNITKGTTVIWENVDDTVHIFKQVGKGFITPIIKDGDSFEYTFNETEVFRYAELNFGARGEIVVE